MPKKRKNRTNKATLFSTDLERRLQELSKIGLLTGYTWKKNAHPSGAPREFVDVVGEPPEHSGHPWIFVEAELHRGHPESNVAKIWKGAEKDRKHRPFLLVQGFSKHYKKSSPKVNKENAKFLGEHMCKELGGERARYFPVEMKYAPRGGPRTLGAGYRKKAAYKLAETVRKKLRRGQRSAMTAATGSSR